MQYVGYNAVYRLSYLQATANHTYTNKDLIAYRMRPHIPWNIFIGSLESSETMMKYADDISIYTTIPRTQETTISRGVKVTDNNQIKEAASDSAAHWCETNFMILNTMKTKHMIVTLRNKVSLQHPVTINDKEIECVQSFKLVEGILDHNLSSKLVLLKHYGVNTNDLCSYYKTMIRALLIYVCPAWPICCWYNIVGRL